MRSTFLAVLLLCTACKGTGDDTDIDTDPVVPTEDTDVPWGDEDGSLALIRTYEEGELVESRLVAFFTNSDQGFLNLATCALSEESPCLRELPSAEGNFVPFDPEDQFSPANSFYRFVGVSLPFGPYEAFYEVTDAFSYYTADLTDEAPFEGEASLALGVEWGPFETDNAAVVPEGLTTSLPLSDQTDLVFSDQTAYPFQWEPGGGGSMYLTVRSTDPSGVNRVYLLEDSGEFLLDISSLGLSGDHELNFELARWTFDTIDVNGSDLTIQTTADSEFTAQFVDVLGREVVTAMRDNCGEAPLGVTPDGQYYGDLTPYSDDTQQAACLPSFDAANGRDGLLDVQIPPRSRLEVNYRQLNANASMYVLESCEEPPVCLLGADGNTGLGIETFSIFNPNDLDALEHVLVLDAADPATGGLFFVDLNTVLVPDPELGDTCIDALGSDPIQPGSYYWDGTGTFFLDNLDPGFTGCTGTSLPGPDGIVPVSILDGQTLEVTVSMEDGENPALYLVQNCQDATTCLTGSDIAGSIDSLTHTNTTGGTQQLFLVLDTQGVLAPFTMTVNLL